MMYDVRHLLKASLQARPSHHSRGQWQEGGPLLMWVSHVLASILRLYFPLAHPPRLPSCCLPFFLILCLLLSLFLSFFPVFSLPSSFPPLAPGFALVRSSSTGDEDEQASQGRGRCTWRCAVEERLRVLDRLAQKPVRVSRESEEGGTRDN